MAARILIVDDEPNIIISIKFLLEQSGYNVTTAESVNEAEEILKQFEFDLILLDVMLPGRDGFQFLQEIRSDNRLKDMIVILLTARGREQDRAKGMSLGANDYVTKPFATKDLVEKIEEALQRHS